MLSLGTKTWYQQCRREQKLAGRVELPVILLLIPECQHGCCRNHTESDQGAVTGDRDDETKGTQGSPYSGLTIQGVRQLGMQLNSKAMRSLGCKDV